MRTKGVEPIHHLWYLALNQAWLPLHHIRIYLKELLYKDTTFFWHFQIFFYEICRDRKKSLWTQGGFEPHPSLCQSDVLPGYTTRPIVCRVDETRTRINVRIPNAAGQPITVLPYVIKKSHINLFFWICVRCLSDIFLDFYLTSSFRFYPYLSSGDIHTPSCPSCSQKR